MHNSIFRYGLIFCGFFLFSVPLMGKDPASAENWDDWFENDYEAEALAVNEGELEFLSEAPDKIPPTLSNRLTITSDSMKDGWVDLLQCHERLDPVSAAQVLYHARRTRDIEIVSSNNIDKAWVFKNSVQMENISKDASLCVKARVKALYPNFDGIYSMRNGPFLRRFLDGYYPMRVTMDVALPPGELSFGAITPQEQAGFTVSHDEASMQVEALFVGLLEIEVYFDEV
jgi:hypothetical protein